MSTDNRGSTVILVVAVAVPLLMVAGRSAYGASFKMKGGGGSSITELQGASSGTVL